MRLRINIVEEPIGKIFFLFKFWTILKMYISLQKKILFSHFRLLGNFLEAAKDLRLACKIDFDDQADEWLREVTPNVSVFIYYMTYQDVCFFLQRNIT